ncbi:hypothetical protein [Xylanivirga thermophila]|nr:hypothetical protein [Xylanivirga thermophila]
MIVCERGGDYKEAEAHKAYLVIQRKSSNLYAQSIKLQTTKKGVNLLG